MSVSSSTDLRADLPGDIFDDCVFGSWPGDTGFGTTSSVPTAGSVNHLAAPSYEHRLPGPPRGPCRRRPLLKAQSFSSELGSELLGPRGQQRPGLLPQSGRLGTGLHVQSTPLVQICALSNSSSSVASHGSTHNPLPIARAKSATPGEVAEKFIDLKRCISMPQTDHPPVPQTIIHPVPGPIPRPHISRHIPPPLSPTFLTRPPSSPSPCPSPIYGASPVLPTSPLAGTSPIPGTHSVYSAFDIVGSTPQARYPWQRDVGIQCNIIGTTPGIPPPLLSPPPPTPKHAARRQTASTQCNLIPPTIISHNNLGDQVVEIHTPSGTVIRPILDRVSSMKDSARPRDRPRTPPRLTVEFEAIDTSERQRLVDSQEEEEEVAVLSGSKTQPPR